MTLYNFQSNFLNLWLGCLLWNFPHVIVTRPHWWSVNIGSGNGLVPSGNNPSPPPTLPRSMLPWHYKAKIINSIKASTGDILINKSNMVVSFSHQATCTVCGRLQFLINFLERISYFDFKFYTNLFPGVQLITLVQIMNQQWLIHWQTYASLGINELMVKFFVGQRRFQCHPGFILLSDKIR